MIHESVYEVRKELSNSVIVNQGKVEVVDDAKLRDSVIDTLIRDAVFGTEPVKHYARWLIWEIGQVLGARPASIHEFYIARGRDVWQDRTVPAMNIRFTTYETARAALRAGRTASCRGLYF